ncbi:protein of unknown function [Nitrospira japonica]|uniref:PilZ domain-containing protein n=1 Tax=Nitrospira japonica TaxID=1325564 RepID=A0A1W1I5H5_9BACT|nr:PilZ domain-containing protein [Nitrospira japonica]SLM48181.1 protein of unknown function [Nitrospira japonica]
MVSRYGPRVPVVGQAVLAGSHTSCEGRVLDLSVPGCLIECPHRLHVGEYVRLRVSLPDGGAAMTVSLAAVRWVCGNRVGLEFIRSSNADQHRLNAFVSRHDPRSAVPMGRVLKWKESITLLGASGD